MLFDVKLRAVILTRLVDGLTFLNAQTGGQEGGGASRTHSSHRSVQFVCFQSSTLLRIVGDCAKIEITALHAQKRGRRTILVASMDISFRSSVPLPSTSMRSYESNRRHQCGPNH